MMSTLMHNIRMYMSIRKLFGLSEIKNAAFGMPMGPDQRKKRSIIDSNDIDGSAKKRVHLALETGVDIPCVTYNMTGSAYICDPPVTNTDEDYVLLVENVVNTCDHLIRLGFTHCSRYPNLEHKFVALRKGAINFIITADEVYYIRYVAATDLAKRLNLTNKSDRINLFHVILDGNVVYGDRRLPLI